MWQKMAADVDIVYIEIAHVEIIDEVIEDSGLDPKLLSYVVACMQWHMWTHCKVFQLLGLKLN